jgi:hypothetical protein
VFAIFGGFVSKKLRKLHIVFLPLTILAFEGASWGSPVTFAQFLEPGGTQDYTLTNTGSSNVLHGSSTINFFYENISGTLPPELQGLVHATLTIDATSTVMDLVSGGNISESGFSGTFSILDNSMVNGQNNLLSGSFSTLATISGTNNGTSANFGDSTPPLTEVTFNSAFINFGATPLTEAFAISFSSVTPSLANGTNNFLAAFSAAGSGTFSADPAPSSVNTPEPVSMLSMGLGLLALGLYGKRRLRA